MVSRVILAIFIVFSLQDLLFQITDFRLYFLRFFTFGIFAIFIAFFIFWKNWPIIRLLQINFKNLRNLNLLFGVFRNHFISIFLSTKTYKSKSTPVFQEKYFFWAQVLKETIVSVAQIAGALIHTGSSDNVAFQILWKNLHDKFVKSLGSFISIKNLCKFYNA